MSTRIRALTANSKGIAKWLEREAQTMHPLQFFREAVQNEIEAGADKIVIDGFKNSDGYSLARVSGNGSGMIPDKLISHLSTILTTDKGDNNYGVGARIAALPTNHAGVTFASKTTSTEGMISIIKSNGVFGLKTWKIADENGDAALHEVIMPLGNELARVKLTGTAVILHGDGRSSTWDNSKAHSVHNYLARRYYLFPGHVSIAIDRPDDGRQYQVYPFGKTVADWAIANGELLFKDIAGLSGAMFWWLLPTPQDLISKVSGHNSIGSGIGIVVDDEIFDYSKNCMTDFGIQYRSIQSRVVMLIAVHGARMDTSRSTVVYPTGKSSYKKTTPWKALGEYFSEHMPAAIDEVMSKVVPSGSIFTDEAARKLDAEWMKWIKPVHVIVPVKTGAPKAGDESGDALPSGDVHENPAPEPRPNPEPKPKLAAHRQNAGDKPGLPTLKVVTPKVQYVEAQEMPEGHPYIHWTATTGTIMISEEFPPLVREIRRWCDKTDHPKSLVETAVKNAYSIEFAAYIIDANAQRTAPLVPEDIESLKSDISLYGKALGCQSLSETIAQYLKTISKSA